MWVQYSLEESTGARQQETTKGAVASQKAARDLLLARKGLDPVWMAQRSSRNSRKRITSLNARTEASNATKKRMARPSDRGCLQFALEATRTLPLPLHQATPPPSSTSTVSILSIHPTRAPPATLPPAREQPSSPVTSRVPLPSLPLLPPPLTPRDFVTTSSFPPSGLRIGPARARSTLD